MVDISSVVAGSDVAMGGTRDGDGLVMVFMLFAPVPAPAPRRQCVVCCLLLVACLLPAFSPLKKKLKLEAKIFLILVSPAALQLHCDYH